MPKERKPLRPSAEWAQAKMAARRFKWITLNDGSDICVWATSAGDALDVMAATIRPPGLAEQFGEIDEEASYISQVMACCHTDEPPMGEKTFGPGMAWAVKCLDSDEFKLIMTTFAEVTQTDAASLEHVKAFTKRTEEGQRVG